MQKNLTLLILSLIFLISCSDSFPSSEVAEGKLREIIIKESNSKIKLNSFTKINGEELVLNGTNCYRIMFEGEIAYEENGFSAVNENYFPKKGFLLVMEKKPKRGLTFNSKYYQKVNEGEKKKIVGNIVFGKTEKGWSYKMAKIKRVNDK